jgi:CRP/FNR family transcriptional regulator, cyclic AMP receptor protein
VPSYGWDNPVEGRVPRCNGWENAMMIDPVANEFDVQSFLGTAGIGRKIVSLRPKRPFFSQGDPANSVFYLQKGRAKVTVLSRSGKEVTVSLLYAGDFIGEESLLPTQALRVASASSITSCILLRIDYKEMIRVLHEEQAFSDLFVAYLLNRSMRAKADLVDQLCNSSEKRLARILLLMAEVGQEKESQTIIPPITQDTLADMIGTTRSRVSHFMNSFRKRGFIEYNGRIHVRKSLIAVILDDQPSDSRNAKAAPLLDSVSEPNLEL